MPTRLIVNADDFGLTLGVNRAVRELHQAGVLTSATLMATGAAFEDAVAIARANPSLGVGCHVVLTDGIPVSPPELIPSLLCPDRLNFRSSLLDFVRDLTLGRIRQSEIELEASAQIRKLQQAGIDVTHIDTHKHTHMFPQVTRPLLSVLESLGIPAIRHPFEARWSWSLGHGGVSRRIQMTILDRLRRSFTNQPQILSGAVRTATGSIGISATGDLNPHTLAQLMQQLPEGTWELVCHPGYNDPDLAAIRTRLRSHRETEREALLSVVRRFLAQPNPPQLIHYGDLHPQPLEVSS